MLCRCLGLRVCLDFWRVLLVFSSSSSSFGEGGGGGGGIEEGTVWETGTDGGHDGWVLCSEFSRHPIPRILLAQFSCITFASINSSTFIIVSSISLVFCR